MTGGHMFRRYKLLLLMGIISLITILTVQFELFQYEYDLTEMKNNKMYTYIRIENRKSYLRKQCDKYGSQYKSYSHETSYYLINRQYHLIWCYVHKAASSAWMYNFNILANYTHKNLIDTERYMVDLAKDRYLTPTVERLKKAQQDSITFIIVRHPLERLHSAYNDRILHSIPGDEHDILAKYIVNTFRKKEPESFIQNDLPTFEEFVRYIINETKTNQMLDLHWVPYSYLCAVCKYNYDVIIKLETIQEDQKYLIELVGLEDLLVMNPELSNKREKKQSIEDTFSTISKTQLRELYEIYKYDFKFFDYKIEEFIKMVKDDGTEWNYEE